MIKTSKISKRSIQNKPVTKQQVRSMIKADKINLIKYTDTVLDFNTVASGATFINLTMPGLGTGQSGRQADTIELSHFDIRWTESFKDSVTTSTDVGFDRVMLFQNIGEDLITGLADVLDSVTTSQNSINSQLSYSNKGSTFHMLVDHVNKVDTFNPCLFHQATVKPSIRKIRFNAIDGLFTTGVPTVAVSRSLVSISGGSSWSLELIVRMWYYDV